MTDKSQYPKGSWQNPWDENDEVIMPSQDRDKSKYPVGSRQNPYERTGDNSQAGLAAIKTRPYS